MPLSFSIRKVVRNYIRCLRQKLNSEQQTIAAVRITEYALNMPLVDQAQHIALYLSIDGELDTKMLISQLWQKKKYVYLPIFHPFSPGHLLFVRYIPETALILDRLFGILGPPLDIQHLAPLEKLDIMFVPLVAFNRHGQRLGMGGGFYDRTLQYWKKYQFFPIGLAHDFQQVKTLPSADWDIPLPAILTPSRFWQWENKIY